MDHTAIDNVLAATLRGAAARDGYRFTAKTDPFNVVARIRYHGIAGLLHAVPATMTRWPAIVVEHVRDQAVAQAMWELRHRHVLNELLAGLVTAKIRAVLLKGTALAYDLYMSPATRSRGDSDLLVEPTNLAAARVILKRQGFERAGGNEGSAANLSLQEVWCRTADGTGKHYIDLHWQLLNAYALDDVIPVAECAANLMELPRLGPDAVAIDRGRTLIHTCIHRAMNSVSPYFVDGQTYYGGDRLIWLHDIRLLAGALTGPQWKTFCRLAAVKGVSAACLEGLLASQRFLGAPVPKYVFDALGASSAVSGPSAYLASRQLGRACRDLLAVPGLRSKLHYFRLRALPPAAFVRAKYPGLLKRPLPLLYARRLLDLLRHRPSQRFKR